MQVKNRRFLPRKLMMLHTYKQFLFINNKQIETFANGREKGPLNITFYLDFPLHNGNIREPQK